jgi:hypothetical protein
VPPREQADDREARNGKPERETHPRSDEVVRDAEEKPETAVVGRGFDTKSLKGG